MSLSPKKYDVFISFRGVDIRTTFASQLHQAFRDQRIESYIDYNLEKGDEVGPALAQAIENSHISLVVFSENYASSKWCLDELLKILDCREHHRQVVIPVFYKIEPTHVRHQTGGFGEAFAKYERELKNNKSHEDKVSKWKAALTAAASISGWDSDSRTHRDDSQLIENIVNDVLQKLSQMYPNELKGLVEVDENSKYIELLLKTLSRIGIWGMGGLGKTTIARRMFAKHFAQYDGVCFLEKVSEESEKFGRVYVRNKLLGELLKRQITASDHGSTFIKRRLSGKKVFIVLDDVDNAIQLEYLCGDLDDLGPNSKLIITTRDRHTLSGKVDEIYEVTKWKLEESLKLFSFEALKQSHPIEGYESFSKRAVAYAGGIPLALKVLGSHFYSRSTKFWKSELNYLENTGESLGEIQHVLKVSYNGLTKREKEMFLDIAFFFKGENKDFITRILDAFGFNAASGVELLEDKALITISNSNRIQMHDLLQKMAFDIVQEESRDPGRRSRLKDAKEIRDVLGNNKGNDAIEGIMFDLSQKVDLHVRADTFNLMTKLRFLKFYIPSGKKRLATVYHPKVIEPFFDKLTYLEWNGYPLKSLPQPSRAQQLVEIRLPHSSIEHLWDGMQELVNLEAIDLSECKQLVNLPDLSRALKLKWMYLSGCESLCEVQPSAFSKDSTLVTLLLDRCTKLQSLVCEKHLTSLKKFNVNGCISLKEFSLSSDLIERLDLSNTGVEILHPSIGGMNKLWWLKLEGLKLQNLPNELSRLRSLTQLRVSNCSVVTKSKLEALFDGLKSLIVLHLIECCSLLELPGNISSLSRLYELRLDGSSVQRLPTSIKYLSELEIQSLDNCKKLQCLPELPPHIIEFHANNCTSLVTVSTLKTFSISMIGKKKYISFKNGLMMELDRPSLDRTTEDAILMMKSAAFHNILVRKYKFQTHSFNYNSAGVCLPGREVPRQFKLRTTGSSIITIDISNSLVGFIFAVVVSPIDGMKQRGNRAIIQCQCYSENDTRVGYASRWHLHHKAITNLNMDHVFVWYDPYHSDSIFKSCERKISFEFCVTTYRGGGEVNGLLGIKECGICPIYYTEIPRLLGTMNLDEDLKSDLYDAIQFESRSVGSYDEEREGNDVESIEIISDEEESTSGICTQIRNQELDLNEKIHRSYDNLIVSKGTQAYDNPREKEKWDDGDNSKEMEISKILPKSSTKSREEIETSSHKQEQSEDVESSFKKAMKSDKSSSDDESYPSISPTRLKGKDSAMKKADSLTEKWKKDEETEDEENVPMDLGKPEGEEDGSDEDPFAELESILLGSPESSAKATCSTSDVAIREALHNLECLLENSLESILGDVELQRQLHMSLECIKQASHEEVSPNVAKLVESMTSSIEELFNDFASTKKVVEDHIVRLQQREKLLHRLSDAKKQKESAKKEKSRCEDEAERLEEEGKMLDEKIRILVEQKKRVELEKAKLKESMERCEGEKKKLEVEAKNMITESKELMSVIKNATSSYDAALLKQQKLNDKWEGFKTAFADNWGS